MILIALIAVVSYLVGSLPIGYLAGRIAGVDVRALGSGNVGATNVTRVLGKKFGYPVFLLDAGKGLVAVEVAKTVIASSGRSALSTELCGIIAAAFAVIGHTNSIWLGFKGGKGVATSIGAMFALNWLCALIVGLVWIVTFFMTRYVSLASIVAAVALPVTIATMFFLKALPSAAQLYFSLCLAIIVIFRHRSNLSRLASGTEPRFVRK
ncbi:MAG TPA: glycerol-3-phosphate 1-O-acyltransferase PlsY [Chthoniobacterales bacterium]|jgi:glycerol-3-phosphate acyltransferase PlsY|nr:glycerol-3-phosphate 1-O-acyltransferase PlsY [Chthoniobacterales bacterium]